MTNNIAKTILQQIRAGTDTQGYNGGTKLMMCWGTNQMINTGKGLRFKVNGALFRGYVEVTLDEGADLYDVEFYTMRRPPRNLKDGDFTPRAQVKKTHKQYDRVYCDQLTGLIDGTVEKA
ncbi:hypothetical protein LCGC14_1171060 [marine sediment metagenome]|uniref:Uncharacterized protein n=1 Tax=marine sediment metagenome TaxID=412755 RepID=A0A0F9PVC7_9ZZZZ